MAVKLIIPTQPQHLMLIKIQEGQSEERERLLMHPEFAIWAVRTSKIAFSLIVDDEVVAALGVRADDLDPQRGVGWALFANNAGKHLRFVLKHSRQVLDNLNMRRIETTASHRLPQAKRWLELLGFQYEGTMRAYDEMGIDHDMYARVTPWR